MGGSREKEGGVKDHWAFSLQEDGKNGWNQLLETLQGLAMCSVMHSNT